jgi:hypothetical protein
MSLNLIAYDLLRRTPSKGLIILFSFIIIGKLSPRFKVLKAYKEYSFKEVEERRKLSFELAMKINNNNRSL